MTVSTVIIAISWFACVINVLAALSCWRMVLQIRSALLLQGEITEIDACVRSLMLAIRRIEGRQTARMRKESSSDVSETSVSAPSIEHMDKAQLRAYAGLIPGRPAKHTYTGAAHEQPRDTA